MLLGMLMLTFISHGVATSADLAMMLSIPSFADGFLIPLPIRMEYFLQVLFMTFVILLLILSAVSDFIF